MSLTLGERAIQLIGPQPQGHAHNMEKQSRELRSIVTEIRVQADAMENSKLHGEGPLVERTNVRAAARATKLRLLAGELEELSASITERASNLRNEQDDWHKLFKRKVDDLRTGAR